MKGFYHLLVHELKTLFYSTTTYVVGVFFLLLMGALFLTIVQEFSQIPQNVSLMEPFFQVFWMPVLFIVPLLTMKSIAEERRLCTLETLMTTSVSSWAIVLSKFLSIYFVYMLLWLLTCLFPFILTWVLGAEVIDLRVLDSAVLLGGLSFVAITGLFYIALGIFASSLTRSQLTAGILSFSFLFAVIVGGRFLAEVPFLSGSWEGPIEGSLEYFQTFIHLEDFTRGVLDSRPFFLYLSGALLALGVTGLIVEAKS